MLFGYSYNNYKGLHFYIFVLYYSEESPNKKVNHALFVIT